MRTTLRFKQLTLFSLLLCGTTLAAHAQDLSLYLSDDSVEGRVGTEGGPIGLEGTELSGGVFVNTDDDLVGDVAFSFVSDPSGLTPWTFSGGPRLYAGSIDIADDNFVAVGLGGEAGFGFDTRWPSRLVGSFYYAPQIASFGDIDRLYDLRIDAELDVTDRATGFFGYRFFDADREDGDDRQLDDNFHVGLRYSF